MSSNVWIVVYFWRRCCAIRLIDPQKVSSSILVAALKIGTRESMHISAIWSWWILTLLMTITGSSKCIRCFLLQTIMAYEEWHKYVEYLHIHTHCLLYTTMKRIPDA
jgi:hypothetical protein